MIVNTPGSDISRKPLHGSRLWKAFEKGEAEHLPVAELAALVLRTGKGGTRGGVSEMIAAMLERHGGLAGLERASPRELAATPGMGPVKALALKAAFEIGRRAAGSEVTKGVRMCSSKDVAARFGPQLLSKRRERFISLLLNGRNELMREHVVSVGSLTSSIVHPREAFLPAVRESAASVIFVHNHPSGDPAPSDEDRRLTERLVEAGAVLGIRVLDHVIVAAGGYVSLLDGRQSGPAVQLDKI